MKFDETARLFFQSPSSAVEPKNYLGGFPGRTGYSVILQVLFSFSCVAWCTFLTAADYYAVNCQFFHLARFERRPTGAIP
jgi:hypothetical protein